MKSFKNIKFLILSLLFIIGILSVSAGKTTAHRGTVKGAYNFWLYNPTENANPTDTLEMKPVVIFLHGASLCGNNLERVRRYGTIDAIEKGRDVDAYVIAPQNPGGAWNPAKVMKIVDYLSETYGNVDLDRVYVMGMSLGGYGTIDLAATYPDRIAAAIALCGGGTVGDYSGLNDVPLWIVHGTADRAVRISESDKVVADMKSSSESTPRLIYNRIPGMNHSQPARMFYLKESYDWLFSHSLKDDNRSVSEAFDVPLLLSTAYKGLKTTISGKKHKVSSKSKSRHRKSSKRSRRRR